MGIESYTKESLDTFYGAILDSEKAIGRIIIPIVAGIISIYFIKDSILEHVNSNVNILQSIRAGFIISSMIILYRLNRRNREHVFYRMMILWICLFFVNKLSANIILFHKISSNLIFDTITILSIYVVVPFRKRQKVVLAIVFSVIDLIIIFAFRDQIIVNIYNTTFVLFSTNIIGYFGFSGKFKYQYASYFTNLENERLLQKTNEQLVEIKQLSDLIPICASCKKVRDDQGYWSNVEKFFDDKIHLKFTHSVCPDCRDDVLKDFRSGS